MAHDLAARWPDIMGEDPDQKLFDLLMQGAPKVMTEDDAYEEALTVLRENKQAEQQAPERLPGEDDDDAWPSWQENLFDSGGTSRATQKRFLDDSPLPPEERDRPDLPGQGRLPGTDVVPFQQPGEPPYRYAAERGNPMQHSMRPRRYEEAPAQAMTEEQMKELLAYQQANNCSPQAAREALGYSAGPCRSARPAQHRDQPRSEGSARPKSPNIWPAVASSTAGKP